MAKTRIWLACNLILVSILACYIPTSTPFPTPWPRPSLDEMRFQDAETGRRFRALDRCIRDIVDDSWQTTSYRVLGNFYEANWCRGLPTGYECETPSYSTMDYRDQHVLQLSTLSYSYNRIDPEFFGLSIQALWVPETTGWGAWYGFSEKGENTVGEGWGVTFNQYVTPHLTDPPKATVQLGDEYNYIVPSSLHTEFRYSSELPIREDLALYLESPEAMRDRGVAHLQTLAQKVSAVLHAHQVTTCDPGPYLGGGIPPECPARPMTASEEAEEIALAEAYFAEQVQLLRAHYQEMYANWMKAFPLDQCWP